VTPEPRQACCEHDWHRTDIVSDLAGTRLFWDACSACGVQRFVTDGGETLTDEAG
jgi:hypothetical protein